MMQFGRKKRWGDLDRGTRWRLCSVALVQIGLLLFALQDWVRRPGEQMRGRKALWLPALFVNFVGPIVYLTWGRHGGDAR